MAERVPEQTAADKGIFKHPYLNLNLTPNMIQHRDLGFFFLIGDLGMGFQGRNQTHSFDNCLSLFHT